MQIHSKKVIAPQKQRDNQNNTSAHLLARPPRRPQTAPTPPTPPHTATRRPGVPSSHPRSLQHPPFSHPHSRQARGSDYPAVEQSSPQLPTSPPPQAAPAPRDACRPLLQPIRSAQPPRASAHTHLCQSADFNALMFWSKRVAATKYWSDPVDLAQLTIRLHAHTVIPEAFISVSTSMHADV